MVQLVISSDSIAPRRPKSAPEAPTETPFLRKSTESTLPPKPDTRYTSPTLPAGPRTTAIDERQSENPETALVKQRNRQRPVR
jgi:hypothetical protein